MPDQTGWTSVYTANSPEEARIVQGRLQAEGIPAWVHSKTANNAFGLTIGYWGKVEVLVPHVHYKDALYILNPPLN
jgi:hypothetical protein